MLELALDRPMAFLDIESTGANPRQDRIIELAVVILDPGGAGTDYLSRFNPQIPIPPQVSAIHGITDGDVAGCQVFAEAAPKIHEMLSPCDLAGFNIIRFDAVMLVEEFARAGLNFDTDARRIVDAQRIFHRKEPRDLSAAVEFFCGERLDGAHSAMADAQAVIRVLNGELKRYKDLPRDVEGLAEFCRPPRNPDWADKSGRLKWENGELAVNFGTQYIGRRLRDLAKEKPKFLRWILTSDFPLDTKRMVSDALEGRFPPPPGPAAGAE